MERVVRLLVDPDPANGSAYLGTKPYRCQFGSTTVPDLELRVGTTTQVGDVPLAYLPPEQQDGYPNNDPKCEAAA